MRIEVAGAGAGKTTKTASRIRDIDIPDGKIVFCVAFTNAAADGIRRKLVELCGALPGNIKVSTIHSFLYTELVHPYYHLLFGVRYKKISAIDLPVDPVYRGKRIKELEGKGLLHQTLIPQRAKWVVCKKSKDNARIKAMRAKAIAMFAGYCHRIVVDEAQDIDENVRDVLLALHHAGVEVELAGDPKQDVKGYGCFREIINMFPESVTYSGECHRCPEIHLRLSNRLACENEKQVADKKSRAGSIDVLFETDEDAAACVANGNYGLAFISKKNDRYDTHEGFGDDGGFDALLYYLGLAIEAKHGEKLTELNIKRVSYYVARQMVAFVGDGGAAKEAVKSAISRGFFEYERTSYARIIESLELRSPSREKEVFVSSIEAVKGLEAERCLFILTTDLAPYLVGDKTADNKTKHLLYVALTRSLDNLTILVTKEVELRYSRNWIVEVLEAMPS